MGHDLSSLQVAAVYFCEIESQADERENASEAFKHALLQVIDPSLLYPDIFTPQEDDEFADPEENETVVYLADEESQLSNEEMERQVMALLAAANADGMSFTGEEMRDG